MVFEYILKQKGLDPAADLSIDQSIDFGSTAAAFSGGTGDFTVEFEPGATSLEKEGKGYVVDSLGVESGYVPYTAYCARGSYLKENEKTVQNFVNALKKGWICQLPHAGGDAPKPSSLSLRRPILTSSPALSAVTPNRTPGRPI